jgi:hypothetical protein
MSKRKEVAGPSTVIPTEKVATTVAEVQKALEAAKASLARLAEHTGAALITHSPSNQDAATSS